MSVRKKCKLMVIETLSSISKSTHETIDWTFWAFCQESSPAAFQCPALSKRTDIGSGYDSLADNLKKYFLELDKQPVPVDISRLDEGDDIVKTLSQNLAKWHQFCRLKCSACRLARVHMSEL